MIHNLYSLLRHTARTIRVTQPFNWILTTSVRAILNLLDIQCEFATRHFPRVGIVTSHLPNGKVLRLWSRGDDWIANQVFWRGWCDWEGDTAPFLFNLASRAQVTIDVGAHVGFYSILCAHANPGAQIFAFEPLSSAFIRLKRNVHLNGLQNVECISSAVGDTEGTAAFWHIPCDGIPSSSSLSQEFMQQGHEHLHEVEVSVVTLDHFVQDMHIGHVDLIKIDVETYEPRVLNGMSEILRRDRPHIVCEIILKPEAVQLVEDILLPLGYRFYLMTPHGLQWSAHIVPHSWRNYLFTILEGQDLAKVTESPLAG